jgi:hypothetical protein
MYKSPFLREMEAEERRSHKDFMNRVSAIYADEKEPDELQFPERQPETRGCQECCFKCCCDECPCIRADQGRQESDSDYSEQMISGPYEQGVGQPEMTPEQWEAFINDNGGLDIAFPGLPHFDIPELIQDIAIEAISQSIPVPGLGIAIKACQGGYDSRD